jgi:flagellar hook-associated protein 2
MTGLSGLMNQPAVKRSLPLIGLLGALAIAALAWWTFQTPAQRPLFEGLAENDKAAVASALQSAGVAYNLDAASGAISVAEQDFHRARMLLAGQGPFTLSVAGQDFSISLTAGNATLTGFADAINASGSGVSASVRAENGGFRLILKGQAGLANSFTLTGASNLNLTEAQAAQNAIVKVDGVSYQRASNSMSDVIPGVTLDLKKADPGALISLGATRPTGAITSTMTDFVAAMNDLKKTLASARSSTNARAVFELERRLSRLIGQPLTSSTNGPRSMADLGVTTNRDGSLTLDSKKLEAALKSWPDAVEAIFNPVRDSARNETTDPGISGAMSAIKTATLASNGGLDALKARLQKEADALALLRTRTEEREAANKDRLSRNFAGMDSRVTSLKATQAYLDQQIAQWNRSS